MTVNRWPDTLPEPSADGFSLSPVDQSIRTNMEAGAQRVRRRTLARLDRMNAEVRMTETEFTAFRAWAENAAYSICGASDDFSAWTLANSTRSVGGATAPDGIAVDRMLETVDNTVHRIGYTLTGAAINATTVVCSVTLKSVSRVNARVYFLDRAGTACSVDINLSTGALSGASGLMSYTSQDRGNGWWRVTITATTGTGAATPIMRVNALSDAGAVTYAGDITKGLDICELQARLSTGYDLFLPTGSDGKVLGSAGGSAWFYFPVASGGGLTTAEARFTGPYKVATLAALRRVVTFEVEVRNA
jgi:hypothetical protein